MTPIAGRAGVLLCGGQSRRMGRPKHLLEFGGRTFLERSLAALAAVVQEIVVSIAKDQDDSAIPPTVKVVHDDIADAGPLSGVASALRAVNAELVAVVSCDAPLVRCEVISLLFDTIGADDAALAVVSGRPQFFPAVYRRAVGALAQQLLDDGQGSMAALIDACRTRLVPESQILACDPWLDSFRNVNTPQEYAALLARG